MRNSRGFKNHSSRFGFRDCSSTPRLWVLFVISLVLAAISCTRYKAQLREADAPILLFSGTGTSASDVAAIKTILNNDHLQYAAVNSEQLNRMPASQFKRYHLFIVPGGNFIDMGNGLSSEAMTNIRMAVRDGASYLGICGGAFLASTLPGYKSLNLTSGVKFGFYSAEEKGIRKAVLPILLAGASTLEQYWEDGPQLSGWGTVVGKYPDGTPAIAQGEYGKGWIVLTGVHPEAPEHWWRGMDFTTPASRANEYASTLLLAALNRRSLPHF